MVTQKRQIALFDKYITEYSTTMAKSRNDRINHDPYERAERRAKVKPYKRQSKQHIFDEIDEEDEYSNYV